jgi:hypothetical protein
VDEDRKWGPASDWRAEGSVKGSIGEEGQDGEAVGGVGGWWLVVRVLARIGERSRMASRTDGWVGPPQGEWARRCAGRTWPSVKKCESKVPWKHMSWLPRPKRKLELA